MAESQENLNRKDMCKAGTSSDVENEYAFDMGQCSEALEESLKPDSTAVKALNDDGGEEEEEEDDDDDEKFSKAKDSTDSDVEYDDDYLKECYKDISSEKLQELKVEAKKLQNEGNNLHRNQSFKEAIKTYTKALNKCPLELASERSVLYVNRAAVFISLDKKKKAILDYNRAIELNSTFVEAILCRAHTFMKLNKLENAITDYQKVLELDKDNREANEACIEHGWNPPQENDHDILVLHLRNLTNKQYDNQVGEKNRLFKLSFRIYASSNQTGLSVPMLSHSDLYNWLSASKMCVTPEYLKDLFPAPPGFFSKNKPVITLEELKKKLKDIAKKKNVSKGDLLHSMVSTGIKRFRNR